MTLCYTHLNNSCPKIIYPLFVRVPLYAFFVTAVIFTVCGNLLVIISIVHFKQLHTPTNYLLLSLAIADLIVGAFIMPLSMIRTVESCWYFGKLFCKVHTSTDITCCTASVLHLSFISIDRYYATHNPLTYKLKITGSLVAGMITIAWGVSALYGFLMIFMNLCILGIEDRYYSITCEGGCFWLVSKTSGSLASVLSFFLPGIIMLSVYLNIYRIANAQVHAIHQINMQTRQISQGKIERKATKTLAVIFGVFGSFWTPFFVCYITGPFVDYTVPPVLLDIFGWVAYLNSACNPIVYGLFYSWFRNAVRFIVYGKVFQPNSSWFKLYSE
ncbi:trace amine-associated receptor 1-like [Denticeps clupeoides]|uniref:trace amine-associated receptor 1-like n=1 Tax=Denticeps clupeoides TaxID=299321 RepID=UPI0010A2F6FE|nr:trace amine-associated receptor 1-like [Denticeps clupeoides]